MILQTGSQEDFPEPKLALQMMTQSVAGLAAQAVNERRGTNMVWVNNGNADMDDWLARWRAAHPAVKKLDGWTPWQLVDRFARDGVIQGYILYRLDNDSVNVATSLAGLLGGVMVDESLKPEAERHGLKMLMDVRDKTSWWCFQTYKDRFNRRILCTQDPRKPHVRDLAIAQKAFTFFDTNELLGAAMAWVEPLSPVIGWNTGDEMSNTDLSSGNGEIQTATDWCMNLPVLMAGTESYRSGKLPLPDPAAINWKDRRSAVSFIDTDGDNVQWFEGNFFRESTNYWGNPARGKIPFGWSCCFAHLTQLCPGAIDYALSTKTTNDSFIEWGGGYYYPDDFGKNRANRWKLLAEQARRTWKLMRRTDTRIIGFNFVKWDSDDARKACEVFAAQTDGLLGILAFQYSQYEAGAGERFWVKDRNGIELPVVTARYSIWNHENEREHSGTPAKVAREIRETVEKTPRQDAPRYDWVIAHAWSYFKKAPGTDESAEDMTQEDAGNHEGECGYSPARWCGERLPSNIRMVSPEELLWRIRMNHDASQTMRFIRHYSDPSSGR